VLEGPDPVLVLGGGVVDYVSGHQFVEDMRL
jgi:hypothetical protein